MNSLFSLEGVPLSEAILSITLFSILVFNLLLVPHLPVKKEEKNPIAFFILSALLLLAFHGNESAFGTLPSALQESLFILPQILFAAAALFAAAQIFETKPFPKKADWVRKKPLLFAGLLVAMLLFPIQSGWLLEAVLLLLLLRASLDARSLPEEKIPIIIPFIAAAFLHGLALSFPDHAPSFQTIAAVFLTLGISLISFHLIRRKSSESLLPQEIRAAHAAHYGIWKWDRNQNALFLSDFVESEILGIPAGTLGSHEDDFRARIHPDDREHYIRVIEADHAVGAGIVSVEFRIRHESGPYRWVALNLGLEHDGRSLPSFVGLIHDITERKWRADHALHDPATHLPGRALLLDRLAGMIQSHRKSAKNPITLILFHCVFPDAPQEPVGAVSPDSWMLSMTRSLQPYLPEGATLARTGAHDLALLLPSNSQAEAETLARTVLNILKKPFESGEQSLSIPVLAGLAISQKYTTADELLEEAEIAVHKAGEGSRDQIHVFASSMRSSDARRAKIEKDIKTALPDNRMSIVYQPIIRLQDSKVVGFEALLRWQHADYGDISPAEFIPIAERSGDMDALGLYVLETASKELAKWQLTYRYETPLFMSINISRCELFRESIVQDVDRAITQSYLPRGSLRLEITESLIMRDPDHANQVMQRLAAVGAGLSIDDFGTGYSSLSCLQDMPFDSIKLDALLVRGLEDNAQTQAILDAIVKLGQELSMDVIAEGVDDPRYVRPLQEAGCGYAQGFFFAKPMDAEKVRAFIPRNRPR